MKPIIAYLRPHIPHMCLQFIIKFTGTIMDLLLPWILSYIIDSVVPEKDMGQVFLWGGLMLFCSVIAISFNIIANRMATGISRKATECIRHDLFVKTASLSAHQLDSFTIPSLMSRLTTDTYNVHQMIDRMQRLGIRAPLLLIGGILVTLTLEPVLTLVLICILPMITFVVLMVSKKGIPLYSEAQFTLDKLVRKVQETMSGMRVIKALSKDRYEAERFDAINKESIQKEQHASILMAVTNPMMQLFLNLGLTIVIVIGAYRVNSGAALPGKIIAFLSYFTIILNAMMLITRIFVIFSKGIASGKRITEVLTADADLKFITSGTTTPEAGRTAASDSEAQTACRPAAPYHIEFQNVSFSYNKTEHNISDISFCLKTGETLGIIGPTGSGKTTILNLLLRFYDYDEGSIFIDGILLRNIPQEILYTQFGVVFQNDFLFADSISRNISFGRGISEESLNKAAASAQAGFIREKEDGFDHRLTIRGSNLSGGQKQRLLLSRALAANPKILLLDDCSSALDYKTDAAFRKALSKNYSTTTTIIIAQRISSIRNADHILVLEEGRAIGYGTHDELLLTCAEYQDIYSVQMGDGEVHHAKA